MRLTCLFTPFLSSSDFLEDRTYVSQGPVRTMETIPSIPGGGGGKLKVSLSCSVSRDLIHLIPSLWETGGTPLPAAWIQGILEMPFHPRDTWFPELPQEEREKLPPQLYSGSPWAQSLSLLELNSDLHHFYKKTSHPASTHIIRYIWQRVNRGVAQLSSQQEKNCTDN